MVLTRDGGSQIYSVPVAGGEATRLSQSAGIDTEPDYSPDGSRILFTSDRAGGPQIYSMSAGGGGASRVTFEAITMCRRTLPRMAKSLPLSAGKAAVTGDGA